jgi:hypothetical protein
MVCSSKAWRGWGLVLFGISPLQAQAPLRLGIQGGLLLPLQGDLRATTQRGLNPSFGGHVEWHLFTEQSLRTRLDFGFFSSKDQIIGGPWLTQTLHTRVRNETLGAEYLLRPQRLGGTWTFGAGLYLIRWTVASNNRLDAPSGTVEGSSSTTWTREGLGLLASYRLSPSTDVELGVVSSHYGQENQPTRVATLNFLWHF